MDERAETVTIPTELGRGDAFWPIAALAAAALVVNNRLQAGWSWSVMLPPLVVFAIEMLTVQGAGDIPYVGSLAAGLRARFGHRQAHEWLLAVWHFWRARVYPDSRDACVACYRSRRAQITRRLREQSDLMPSRRLRLSSWACRIRSRLSRQPDR